MTDPKVATTPEVDKNTEVPTPVAPTEPVEPKEEAKTISEKLETPETVTPKEADTVGLDKFLKQKTVNKELREKVIELEQKVARGMTDKELSDDIEDLAEEFGVNSEFLSKLESKLTQRIERTLEGKLKPLTEKQERERIDSVFKASFDEAIASMPEFKGVANPETIKQLSLVRDNTGKLINGDKTFEQLIEETYGNAIGGKRTLETTTPRGGKEPAEIDFARASRDSAYFNEIMADPTLKAKYNKNIELRLKL